MKKIIISFIINIIFYACINVSPSFATVSAVPNSNTYVTDGAVNASVIGNDGNIYIGGAFTQVGPYTGRGAQISTTTGTFSASYPKVNGTINAVISDGSGGWYIGGTFTFIDGTARNNLAHITSTGTLDTSWNPSVNNTVSALAISGSTIYAGGTFTSVNTTAPLSTTTRTRLASFNNTDGTVTSWDPSAGSTVTSLAISGSTIYAGGSFTTVNTTAPLVSTTRNRLAAFNNTDGTVTSWNPSAGNAVNVLAISGSTIYAGGSFTSVNTTAPLSTTTRTRLASFNNTDGTVTSWDPSVNSTPFALLISGSTIYAGGAFTSVNTTAPLVSTTRNRLAAFNNTDGTVTSWDPSANTSVLALAISGSTIYAGGQFGSVNTTAPLSTTTRNNIAAFNNTDGTVTSWDPHTTNDVNALAISGSTIYAGGAFTSVNTTSPLVTTTRTRLASFNNTDGTVTSWDPSAGGQINTLAISGSTIYAGGTFTTVNTTAPLSTTTRNRLASFNNTDGTVTSWDPSAGGSVLALAISGSTIYAGGIFTSVNTTAPLSTTTRNRLASFNNTDGTVTSWNPSANTGQINALAISGSTIYAGGNFTSVNTAAPLSTTARNRLASFNNTDGTVTSWDPNVGSSSIAVITIGGSTIYAGGTFNLTVYGNSNFASYTDDGNVAPSSPTSLSLSGAINTSYAPSSQPTLTFTLADSNTSDQLQYQIQISSDSGFSTNVVDYTSALASQTSGSLAGSFTVGQSAGSGSYATGSSGQTLTGGSYYWRVRATDNSGLQSGYTTANSGSVGFIVDLTAPTTPGTPSTTTPSSTSKPTWTWTASTDSGSGLASPAYTVQWSKDSTFTTGVTSSTATTNSFTHSTALTDGTWYFHVKATDLVNNASSYSSNGTVVVDTTSPTTPGTPAYSISSATPTKPTWTWTASTDSGSGLASPAYTVQWCDNISFTSCSSNTATATTTTYTHTTALTEGTWYFRVTVTDLAGNVSSYSDTTSIVIDITAPNSFDLENPEDGGYTNNPRPTFQWKTATIPDATSGISKYKLSIDNGEDGDFYIDSIPTSGTTDITQANYIIHFDGFSDTDATNNYISVYTKSSSVWSSSQNDGALKEGKRTWTITAYDNSGNSTSASRTLYVDFTNPVLKNVSLEKICNDGTYAVNLNTSPSISGNLSDDLLPYKIEVSFYKKNFFLGFYTSQTLADIESLIIPNNSGDKELSFSVSPSKALDYGKYSVTVVGLDKAGNHSTETSLDLQLVPLDKAHTQTCIAKQLQNLKQSNTASLDNLGKQVRLQHEEAVNQLNQAFAWLCHLISSIASAFQETGSTIFAFIQERTLLASHSQADSSKHVAKMHKEIVVAFQALFSPVNSTLDVVNTHLTLSQKKIQQDIKNNHAQTSLRITQEASKLTIVTVNVVQQPLIKANQFLQRLTAGANIFYTYVFDNNPTKIVRVQLESIGKNEMTVVWETNQYTINNKLNYGETTSYDKSVWAVDATKIHKVTLKGLKPDTTYKFEVMSQGKNYAYDAYYTVKTKKN